MKIRIRKDLCCGAGLCLQTAPGVFRLDALGYNASDGCTVPPGMDEAARNAARTCPERAIELLTVDETPEMKS
jgi:ferredoxin